MFSLMRFSDLTGNKNVMSIRLHPAEYLEWAESCPRRDVQDFFPHLSSAEREFILTGITPDEWNSVFANTSEDGPQDSGESPEFWEDESCEDWTDEDLD